MQRDTIFAPATPPGKSGVAIVRVSGPAVRLALQQLVGCVPAPRLATLRTVRAQDGSRLDQALVLFFEDGASFTGEDVAELHLHGSAAVVRAVLEALAQVPGCRPAEAGEFTRRALESGQLDLIQVEALADLIAAETESQRRQAEQVFSKAFSEKVASWRAKLLRAAALLEATIDFVDEDVPVDVTQDVAALLDDVIDGLQRELDGYGAASRIRNGFTVAIVGPPNVGKSTLMNAIAGRDVALTSDVAGTTRDVIEVNIDLNGLPVTFLDTAGLRDTDDRVEALGVARARQRAGQADVRVFLSCAGQAASEDVCGTVDFLCCAQDDAGRFGNGVSGLTGYGIDRLLRQIEAELQDRVAGAGVATRERHREALALGKGKLEAARRFIEQGEVSYDLVSEEVRRGVHDLEALVGYVGVEDVLEEIFQSFCIGK